MVQLVDFSQLALGQILGSLGKEIQDPDESTHTMIRHIILNGIKTLNKKYKADYGDIVICCDSRNYWRKRVFPEYKANRKTAREKSPIDWDFVFKSINTIKEDLKTNFPYKFLEVDGAEGDDLIAVITKKLSIDDDYFINEGIISGPAPVLIASSDGDFHQLHKYNNVQQHSFLLKGIVKKTNDYDEYLITKILKAGEDGIPNIHSPNDFYTNKDAYGRAKGVTTKLIESVIANGVPPELEANYKRNEQLISFDHIPVDIITSIMDAYHDTPIEGTKSTVYHYFANNKMMQHLDQINDFL